MVLSTSVVFRRVFLNGAPTHGGREHSARAMMLALKSANFSDLLKNRIELKSLLIEIKYQIYSVLL